MNSGESNLHLYEYFTTFKVIFWTEMCAMLQIMYCKSSLKPRLSSSFSSLAVRKSGVFRTASNEKLDESLGSRLLQESSSILCCNAAMTLPTGVWVLSLTE